MKFTIIIPNKNNTELLQRCLNSIPLRDDIQIIVVDDNSDVNMVDFNNYPGCTNPNVDIIFTKESLGAGHARNVGLEHAKGDWIIFSDSDDEFITDVFSEKLTEYCTCDADIVFFDVKAIDFESGSVLDSNNQYQNVIHSTKDLENKCRFGLRVPWGKMIRRSLVDRESIKFEEIPVANDAMFSLLTGYYAKKIIIDQTPVYRWYVGRSGSITTFKSRNSILTHFDCSVRRNSFMINHKIVKYRSYLFLYIPAMVRSGMSYKEAVSLVLRNTNNRYVVADIIISIRETVKKYIFKKR